MYDEADMPDPAPSVGIAPVPTNVNVASVQIGDEPAVALEITTPIGVNVFFLGRDTAIDLSSVLKKAAQTGPRLAKPGLVVPR
jgi:hypothetical protein